MAQQNNPSFAFETGHQDLIHDAQLDYYGRTLATASSDRTIRIFQIIKDKHELLAELQGHTGPIWRLSWSHPKYGNLLASCSYDRRLIIWNNNNNQWQQYYIDDSFQSSVNCISWAPVDLGLILIAGCADGTIHIYNINRNNNQNQSTFNKLFQFKCHDGGVNGLSWSLQNNISDNNIIYKRFVSGGCDNFIKIWLLDIENKLLTCTQILGKDQHGHMDWIRDVAWAPIPGATSHSLIASASEDKTVIIWKEKNKKWINSYTIKLNDKVWSVSWSELGNILAIAFGENQVQLYKEGMNGEWNEISKMKPQK